MDNKIYAVLDVGSNSVRLMISKNGQTIAKFATVTRLSKGITLDGILQSDSIERTVKALSFFTDKARKEFNVDEVYIFATAGVRLAKNKNDFLSTALDRTGICIDVISGDTEAEIGALGALNGEDGGFIDIGGKSTEIAEYCQNYAKFIKSINLGVVTLTEMFGQNANLIKDYCKNFFVSNIDSSKISSRNFVAVAGTATTLASIALGLKEYDFKAVNNYFLSKTKLEEIIKKLSKLSPHERLEKYCIQKGREDVILAGAVYLNEIISHLSLKGIVVKDSDNLEGYLIKKVGKNV